MGGCARALINGKDTMILESDNFYRSPFKANGRTYQSSEQFYQVQKCINLNEKDVDRLLKSGPGVECWQLGQRVKCRSDWMVCRVRIMLEANILKFQQNEQIAQILLSSTGPITFTRAKGFWPTWNSRILEITRETLKGDQADKEYIEERMKMIEQLEAKERKKLKK